LRELFETIGIQIACQPDCRFFLEDFLKKIPTSMGNFDDRPSSNYSHSAKFQNIYTLEITSAEHSAPELPNSTAVAWVWIPAGPYFQAFNRDQTLGLRSVVP